MTLVNAYDFTKALGGEWSGYHGQAPCPVCQPERRSDQWALLLRDWTEVNGLMLLCREEGCESANIMKALHQLQPYTGDFDQSYTGTPETDRAWAVRRKAMLQEKAFVQWIWEAALPIQETPAEVRLRAMGITGLLPNVLRFHPAAWHPFGPLCPAMVARTNGWGMAGVHLTYLPSVGSGKALPDPADAFVGHKGYAVQVYEPSPGAEVPLVVAESIETALRLQSLVRKPVRIWAALSPEGLETLHLPSPYKHWQTHPPAPGHLSITWDGGMESRRAAYRLSHRARAANWNVDFLAAPDGWAWADMLGGHLGLLPRTLLPADMVPRQQQAEAASKTGLAGDEDIPF